MRKILSGILVFVMVLAGVFVDAGEVLAAAGDFTDETSIALTMGQVSTFTVNLDRVRATKAGNTAYADAGVMYVLSDDGNVLTGHAEDAVNTTSLGIGFSDASVHSYTFYIKWDGAQAGSSGITFVFKDTQTMQEIVASRQHLTVTASAQVVNYTVTVKDVYKDHAGNSVLNTDVRQADTKAGGAAFSYNALNPTGYTLSGTATQSGTVTGNQDVVFTYLRNAYTVTYKDWDGSVLKSETVEHGLTTSAPANPTRSGYTFSGWSPAVTAVVTGDATYTAGYTQNGGGGSSGGNSGGSGAGGSGSGSGAGDSSGGSGAGGSGSGGSSGGNPGGSGTGGSGSGSGGSGAGGSSGGTSGGTGTGSESGNGDGSTGSDTGNEYVISYSYGASRAELGTDGRACYYGTSLVIRNTVVVIDNVRYLAGSDGFIVTGEQFVRTLDNDYLIITEDGSIPRSKVVTICGKTVYADDEGLWAYPRNGKGYVLAVGARQIYIQGDGYVAREKVISSGGKKYWADSDGTLFEMSKVGGLKVKQAKGAAVKISWSKKKGMAGYQVQTSYKKGFGKKASAFTKKRSIKAKGKAGKTLYVRVRAYVKVKGKKKYTPWKVASIVLDRK